MNARKLCLVATAWTCVALPTSIAQQTDFDALREEIRTAWAKRRKGIKTLRVEATIDHFMPGVNDPQTEDLDPFGKPPSRQDLRTDWDLFYRSAGDKCWLQVHTDEHPLSGKPWVLKPYTFTVVFDGKENRHLTQSAPALMPLGQVAPGSEPEATLAVGDKQWPVLLWKDPENLLDRIDCDVEGMYPVDPATTDTDKKYARFIVPRGGEHWTVVLDLDPKHAWIPVRLELRYRGKVKSARQLEYDTSDPEAPKPEAPKIVGWRQEHYNEQGKLQRRNVAKVTKFEINEPIAAEMFDLPFPVGTHLIKFDERGRKHIFAQGENELIPLRLEDYGRPDEE